MTRPPGRVALVTGAGAGHRRGLRLRLAPPAIGSRWSPAAPPRWRRWPPRCRASRCVLPTDVLDPAALESASPPSSRRGDRSTTLVANAGAAMAAPLVETTDEQWQQMLDLNLTAPFRCIRRALPVDDRVRAWPHRGDRVGRRQARRARASRRTPQASTAFSAWSERSPPRSPARGVTANAVCPGYVDTPMTDQTRSHDISAGTGRTPRTRARSSRRQPIGRLVTPSEVAAAVMAVRRERRDQRAGHQRRRRSGAVMTFGRINPPGRSPPRRGFSHAVSTTGHAPSTWPGRPRSTRTARSSGESGRAVRAGPVEPSCRPARRRAAPAATWRR